MTKLSDLIDAATDEFIAEQYPDGEVCGDEVWLDMARAVIDSGGYAEEGITRAEVVDFCRAYGIRGPA